MQLKLSTSKYLYFISFSRIKLANTWTTGTSNRTEDGMYLPYLDYDFIELSLIRDELRHFQQIFNLGSIYIFQSSEKRYHAISLSKMTAQEFINLLESSSCDAAFKKIPRYRSIRNWVLRCFSKGGKQEPMLIEMLESKTKRQESSAHFRMLRILYPEIKPIQNPDSLSKLAMVTYATAERKKQ